MEFHTVSSPAACAKYVAAAIRRRLEQGQRVLWLLSGGSAVAVAVQAARLLQGVSLANLAVSLIDERFSQPGHPNSNWHELMDAGLDLPGATMHAVLAGKGQAETAHDFAAWLETQLDAAQYRLGLVGIGPDGHALGILPHSPAVDTPGLVFAYDGGDFQRITTTAALLSQLDEAVAYVAGPEKWPVLRRLRTDIPPAEQPAQLLKAVPKLVIFTDYKGGAS